MNNVHQRLDFGKDLFDESGCPGWSIVDGHEEDLSWRHGETNDEVKW